MTLFTQHGQSISDSPPVAYSLISICQVKARMPGSIVHLPYQLGRLNFLSIPLFLKSFSPVAWGEKMWWHNPIGSIFDRVRAVPLSAFLPMATSPLQMEEDLINQRGLLERIRLTLNRFWIIPVQIHGLTQFSCLYKVLNLPISAAPFMIH